MSRAPKVTLRSPCSFRPRPFISNVMQGLPETGTTHRKGRCRDTWPRRNSLTARSRTVPEPFMSLLTPSSSMQAAPPDRRAILKWTTALAGASSVGVAAAGAQTHAPGANGAVRTAASAGQRAVGGLHKGMIGYMLAHEQFPVPDLVRLGAMASQAGFEVLATSDHLQPWQGNEGHSGQAWVTMGALGAQAPQSWMGTTVTCPTFRYSPAV